MATGSLNVSTNSKIENDILNLQNKDNEIINKIGTTDISTIGDGTLTNGLTIIDEELQNNSFGKFAGAINLFDPSLVTGVTWGSSSYTSNGITLTFNSDYTVTIDGTSTALTSLSYIHITDLINKIGKPVKLLNYDFEVEYYEGTTYAGKVMCRGTIPTGKTRYCLYFRVNSGATFDNLTTNIMLVETSFGDNSADEPFIKSNLQLTNEINSNKQQIQSLRTQYGSYLTSIVMTSVDANKTLFILSDVTDWYNKTVSLVRFFISGNVVFWRSGHLHPDSNFGSIDIRLGYRNESNFDYRLRSSIGALYPIIVSKVDDDGNTKYYLAINYVQTQDATILFSGMIYSNNIVPYPIFTNKIAYSPSKVIPDGYTVVKGTERMTQSNLAIGSQTDYYDYDKIKALEDRIYALENK